MDNYEEKYKKALAWMQGLYKGLHGKTKEEAEEAFPELAESEGERIRKRIIHALHGDVLEMSEIKEAVDWLEKQGNLMKALQISNSRIAELVEEKYNLEEKLKTQGEQKPADKVEPMSLDEAIEHCKEKSCGNNACALEHKQLKEWLTELKELRGHKPSEWSKEDEKIALSIEQIFNCASLLNIVPDKIEKVRSWLNSLRDRMLLLPKQEWSKEDEAFYQRLEQIVCKVDIEAFQGDRDLHDWLKSLRPQKRWKPSDEQIKVCKEVYAGILSAKRFDLGTVNSELNRLEEQLKKLREE